MPLGPPRVVWTLTDLSMYVDEIQIGYVNRLNTQEDIENFAKTVGLNLKIKPRQLVVYTK